MEIKNLGDKVQITETIGEINKSYTDVGLQAPIVVLDQRVFAVRKWVTREELAEMYPLNELIHK